MASAASNATSSPSASKITEGGSGGTGRTVAPGPTGRPTAGTVVACAPSWSPTEQVLVERTPRSRAGTRRGARAGARRRAQPGRSRAARRLLPGAARLARRHPRARVRRRGGRARRRASPAPRSARACSASPVVAGRPSCSRSPPRSARRCPTRSTSSPPAACPRCSSPRTTRWSPRPRSQPGRGAARPRGRLRRRHGRAAARQGDRVHGGRHRPHRREARARRAPSGSTTRCSPPRELDPAALAADITDGRRARRRDPRAGGRRLRRHRPRGRRPARPHRAVGMMAGTRTQVDLGALLMQANSGCSARCCAPDRSRRRPRRPTGSRATSCRCSPVGDGLPVVARTLPLADGAGGLRPARGRRACSAASCST